MHHLKQTSIQANAPGETTQLSHPLTTQAEYLTTNINVEDTEDTVDYTNAGEAAADDVTQDNTEHQVLYQKLDGQQIRFIPNIYGKIG